MAHRTFTTLVDDLSGAEGDDVQTVQFGLFGRTFEIDLDSQHQGELEAALEPYLSVARKVAGRGTKPVVAAKSAKRTDLAEVRAWAVEHGYSVAERGRVAQSILDAFDAA